MLRRSIRIFLIALSFIIGIAVRSWVEAPLIVAYAIGWVGLIVTAVAWKRERWRAAGICWIVLALGIWRLDVAYQAPGREDPSFFIGKGVVVSGKVASDPEVRLKTVKVVVKVREVYGGDKGNKVNGKTLVIASALQPFEVGDRASFRCDLEKPEPLSDFDYPRYLAKDGIYSVCNFPEVLAHEQGERRMRWALARLKRDFISSLERVVPEPESAFLAGVLTGTRGRIPETVLNDFKTAGVSHLLAISGYNIVIIATGVLGVLTLFIRRHAAFPVLVLFIIGFTLLVGGSASVVRAAIMGLVLHACYVSDRWYRPSFVLTQTAAVMLALNPRLLRDDLGFDLSFLATLGLITIGPWFKHKLSWVTDRWHIREGIAMTLAAQVMTLPLLVGSFDRASLVSLPANALIVPFIPLVMVLGFGAGVAGVLPGIGQAVGVVAFMAGRLVITIAHWFAALPFAAVSLPGWSWSMVVLLYGLVGVGIWQRKRLREFYRSMRARRKMGKLIKPHEEVAAALVEYGVVELDVAHPPLGSPLIKGENYVVNAPPPSKGEDGGGGVEERNIPGLVTVLKQWVNHHRSIVIGITCTIVIASLFVSQYLLTRKFSVTIFDVGQGDSILVSAPGGRQLLIDGGPDATILSKLGKVMPWWDKTIEYMVLTHPHADHATGLVEVLKRYKVEKVLMTGVVHTTNEYLALLQEIKERKVNVTVPRAGDAFTVGEAQVKVLAPFESYEGKRVKELNDTSIVLRVEYHDSSFLFTGDAGIEVEPGLIERWGSELESDVLKVGHQGSADASSEEFIEAVSPRYAVISVGEKNMYGHPSPRIVRRLENAGMSVLRTDRDGDVRVVVDERGLRLLGR